MVSRVRQLRFSAVPFSSGRFNLHINEHGRADVLLLFIHGLNGQGYETWGNTLARVFDGVDGPATDVAVFDYLSGLRRLTNGSSSFDFRVKQLAEQLAALEKEYRHIFLVGHSLGGLIAQDVARLRLEAARAHQQRSSLASLILVAAPRAGSKWVNPATRALLGNDYEMLRVNSQTRSRIDDYFDTYVERRNSATAAQGQVVLPVFAAIAGNDRMVSGFSAAFALPVTQRKHLQANHRGVAKSLSADSELVSWFHTVVEERLKVRAQAEYEGTHAAVLRDENLSREPRPILVTEFWGDELRVDWAELYNEVRREMTSSSLVIEDVQDAERRGEARVDLLIHIQQAERVLSEASSSQERVMAACARRGHEGSLTVGISPIGVGHHEATSIVGRWVREQQPLTSGIYVAGAAGSKELQDLIARWLLLVVNRDSRRFDVRAGLGDSGAQDARLDFRSSRDAY